jgi:hypothetical protein
MVSKKLVVILHRATKLSEHHEGIPEEAHDDCGRGWNESFDKLENNMKCFKPL